MIIDEKSGLDVNNISREEIPDSAIKIPLESFPKINAFAGQVINEIKETYQFKDLVKMTYELGPSERLQTSDVYGYTARIVNSDGEYVRSVGLHDISNATAVANSAMAVLSVVTSQYYLHEINKTLDYIQVKLDSISRFLETDKRCHIVSREHYIADIQKHILDIKNNGVEIQAVLSELQQLEIESYSDYLSFTDMISNLIESIEQVKNQEGILELIGKINEYIPQLWSSLYLYACSKYFRMVLSDTVDKDRIDDLYNELSLMINEYDERIIDFRLKSQELVKEHKMYKTNEKLFGAAKLFPGAVGIPGILIHTMAVDGIKEMVQDKKDKKRTDAAADLFDVFYYTCQDTEPMKQICENIKLYNMIYNEPVDYIFDENDLYIVHNDCKTATE